VAQNAQPQQQDEVVRVYTELVQTDVMVFDKEGRFVKGLTRDDFRLRVDGQVVPIEAFELITQAVIRQKYQYEDRKSNDPRATRGRHGLNPNSICSRADAQRFFRLDSTCCK
jgi:hypothetical protein